ncbi:excalibur calcium-binding domain-containing protein [Arthrobacter sp. zg-Y826]|nr:excalibur calcium-binding domain-containing protein [Arthrobacter jinronghuae]
MDKDSSIKLIAERQEAADKQAAEEAAAAAEQQRLDDEAAAAEAQRVADEQAAAAEAQRVADEQARQQAVPAPVVPAPAPPAPPASVYYPNCTAARNAGGAPVYAGGPGYGTHLDRDGDGVGCE